jgi:hypothetical protein
LYKDLEKQKETVELMHSLKYKEYSNLKASEYTKLNKEAIKIDLIEKEGIYTI